MAIPIYPALQACGPNAIKMERSGIYAVANCWSESSGQDQESIR